MPDDRDPAPPDARASAPAGPGRPPAPGLPDDPGAPVPRDAIDPALVSLRPRRRLGILTAASVVVLCGYLGVRLRADLAFSRQPGTPREVTVASVLAGEIGDDAHVALTTDLERTAAIRVRDSKGRPGLRLVPALGAGDRVWLAIDGSGWKPAWDGAPVAGRLRRLSALPFDDVVRAHWRAHTPPRFVRGDELRARLSAGGAALTAVTGEAFTAAPGDLATLDRVDPDAVTLVGLLGSELPDGAAWAARLASANLLAPGASPATADAARVTFELRRPGALAAARAAQDRPGLSGLRLEPVSRPLRAPWSALAASDAGLAIDGITVPWAEVDVVRVDAARPLPADPWVLLAGERPSDLWYVLPLYGALTLFGLLFGWGLVRGIRAERARPLEPAAAPAEPA